MVTNDDKLLSGLLSSSAASSVMVAKHDAMAADTDTTEPRAPVWAEAQAMEEKRLSSIRHKIVSLTSLMAKHDAEAKAEAEERLLLMREYVQLLASEMTPPDLSGMSEADRAAEAERLRRDALEEARRLRAAGVPVGARWREGGARILDFDPKQSGTYFNRCSAVDLTTFDHDEESPFGPMRFTDAVYREGQTLKLCPAVNILSVKIACSDVGYPIRVYGTVIARDSIDNRCVYIFRRDRDHCQLIKSKDKPLMLTGPKRGLALLGDNFVEIDLKIRDRQGQDRELSKEVLTIRSLVGRSLPKCEVESQSLETRLSTVDVTHAVVRGALEATIAVPVVEGDDFVGKITAHNDSKAAAGGDGHGELLQLMRSVVSVSVKDKLIVVAKTGDGGCVGRIVFTPRVKGGEEGVIYVGASKMSVKVAWSIMDP